MRPSSAAWHPFLTRAVQITLGRGVMVAFERAPFLLLPSKLISSDLGLPGTGGCNEMEVAGVENSNGGSFLRHTNYDGFLQ